MAGEGEDVFSVLRGPGPVESVDECSLEFGKQERKLVRGGIRIIRHQVVEAGHESLDVYVTVLVKVALCLEEFARLREPGNLLYEEIITEIVDEERGVGDEGPREAGAGHIYVVRSVLHVKAWSRECPVSRLRGRRAYAVPAPTPMLRDVRSPRPPARCVRLAIGGGAPARDDGGRS